MKQPTLRPADVAVALALCLEEGQSYPKLAEAVGVSLGEAHNAVRRLTHARLLSLTGRRPIRPVLAEYLASGVPYSFPAEIGPETRGVATADAADPLSADPSAASILVWPSAEGALRGRSLTPLYPGATSLPERNPRLYQLLALVDSLRTGQSRERKRAKELLTRHILAQPAE